MREPPDGYDILECEENAHSCRYWEESGTRLVGEFRSVGDQGAGDLQAPAISSRAGMRWAHINPTFTDDGFDDGSLR